MAGQTVLLAGPTQRQLAKTLIDRAPVNAVVNIRQATRTGDQNSKFHAICSDISRSQFKWAGKRRTADEWKVLLVSGHTVATKGEVDIVPGIEGEFVNIRESTARMGVGRASSLIEYTLAFCAEHEIPLNDDYSASPPPGAAQGRESPPNTIPADNGGRSISSSRAATASQYASMKG